LTHDTDEGLHEIKGILLFISMKYISHRGNLIGPYPDLENRPDYILNAINSGFECECDVWWRDGSWWLGHDKPQYEISEDFLTTKGLWIHAKNTQALHRLANFETANYFWHETDQYTLTSHGYIWAYPGSELTSLTICVMPENAEPLYTKEEKSKCEGICSDYIVLEKLEEIRRNA
jgi:hypothetical protein